METVTKKHINELAQGSKSSFALLCVKAEDKTSSNNKKYKAFQFFDGKTTFRANMWNVTPNGQSIKEKDIVIAIIEAGQYNGSVTYTVQDCRKAIETDNINKNDLLPISPIEPEILFEDLMIYADQLADNQISRLVTTIYSENKNEILHSAAASSIHHNIIGGLLYHTYRMVQLGEAIVSIYPAVNHDLIIAGIMLHDIGKLKEMNTNDMGITTYTKEGNLLGHLAIGINMVIEYGKKLEISEEIILNLTHIIASHHGKPEWGAIAKPATLEAALIHHIDMIDSRVYQYEEAYKTVNPGTMSEQKYFGLDNVFIYRSALGDDN